MSREEEILRELPNASSPGRDRLKAELDLALVRKLTDGLTNLAGQIHLSAEATRQTVDTLRESLDAASEASSKHARALVHGTWVLAAATIVLAFATLALVVVSLRPG